MNCRYASKHMVDLLDASPEGMQQSDLYRHVSSCPRCAGQYEEARQVLDSLRPRHVVSASPDFKERVMSEIRTRNVTVNRAAPYGRPRGRYWKPVLAAAAAVVVLAALFSAAAWLRGGGDVDGRRPAFAVLSQAWAAEEAVLQGGGIVHISNEIVVRSVSDPALARSRWLPLCSVGASGELGVSQLALPGEPGQEYTVNEDAWYDRATGRFARVLAVDGGAVFANAYDGTAVYHLDAGGGVEREAVDSTFQPPDRPAALFGMGVGLKSQIEREEGFLDYDGAGTLEDGSSVSILKAGMPDPDGNLLAYWLFKIRDRDGMIAEMDFVAGGEPVLVVRRKGTESVSAAGVPWDLAGITGNAAASGITVTPDMVKPDVSVQQMVAAADFETYVLGSDPPWAPERTLVDVLDLASPPQRMFFLAYRAGDGRHVVLVQAPSYNKMLGPLVKTGRLVYESPNGFKVWSGPRDQWLAGLLLSSARAWIRDAAGPDRTGYALESPAGTFPCLAVNGPITDAELHGLIDSLVPAGKGRND